MTVVAWLAVYSALVLLSSLFGGSLPFLGRVTHSRLQFYLSLSAGVMLGAAFFHVMPDAIEKFEGHLDHFGWWMALAVVGLFCIERFIAPHSHEVENGQHHSHGEGGHHHHEHHHHEHPHDHKHEHGDHFPAGKEPRAAAPAVAGWMAVLGLTIHTFMNGFGLAGEVRSDMGLHGGWFFPPPGWAIFLAIALHKPADALAISMVLSRKGVARRWISLVQLGFALMVPIGAATFYLVENQIDPNLREYLTGAALAFSAGTFLFIALSDLLPEVQFHQHDRLVLFLTLVGSVLFMAGIGLLEGLGKNEPEPAKQEKLEGNPFPGRGTEAAPPHRH
jgi:zinc and cadmium transporter